MFAPEQNPPRVVPNRFAGAWYFVVTIASAGLFAVIPFVHAATRLRRPSSWVWVAVYGVIDAALFVVMGIDGNRPEANGSPLNAVVGTFVIALIITACVHLRFVRREAYGFPPVPRVGGPPPVDAAVARVLAGRARRAEARQLVVKDPLMARELRIGRPDLGSDYDDGGVVDLAGAPATVIAQLCGLTAPEGERIAAAQGTFSSVDELLVLVDLPVGAWDRVRDRGVVVQA